VAGSYKNGNDFWFHKRREVLKKTFSRKILLHELVNLIFKKLIMVEMLSVTLRQRK
jgi:hypothetical protein